MFPNLFPQQRSACTQGHRSKPPGQLGLHDDGASAQSLLAQHFGPDLAKRGFRDIIEEHHTRRDHSLVEIRSTMRKDIRFRNLRSFARNDARDRLFAKQRVRDSNHGTLPDIQAQDGVDYSLWVDLHPPYADELFDPASDEQLAISVEIADVPGREPLIVALGFLCGRIVWMVDGARPVPLELNLPDFAQRQHPTVQVDESHGNG